MSATPNGKLEARVLAIFKDRGGLALAGDAFEEAGIDLVLAADLRELCVEARRGVGAIVLTEEALHDWMELAQVMKEQPDWSAVPVVVLLCPERSHPDLSDLIPVTELIVLNHPMRSAHLVAVLQAALKSRNRQYAVRDQMESLRLEVARREASEQSLLKTVRHMRLLSALGERLLEAQAPTEAASAAFELLAVELGLDAYFNFLVEPDGALRLDSFAGVPEQAALVVERLEPGEAVCGLVAQTSRSLGANEIQQSDDARTDFLRCQGLRAYYCTPLQANGRLIGTISFATRSRDGFGEEETHLLDAAAHHLSLTFQRLHAETQLRQSEERFRVTQELSPDGFVILRPVRGADGTIGDFIWLYENPAAAKLNGTQPDDVVGRSLLQVLPAHDKSVFHSFYREVAETGTGGVLEAPYDDNQLRGRIWCRVAVVPLGKDIAILAHDVTQQREAEEALREGERRYRELFETMQDLFLVVELITDADGKAVDWLYLEVNPVVERVLGRSRQEVVGRSYREMVPVPDEEWIEMFATVARSGQPMAREIFSPQMRRWLEVKAYAPRSGQVAAVCRDISEQKWILDELKRSERQFRQLAEALPQIVWMARPDGRIDYVNARWYQYTGAREDMPLEGWVDFLHPEDAEDAERQWRSSLETGERLDTEFRLRHRDGEYRWFIARGVALVDEHDKITHWFGTCTDIEDQKRARQAAEAAARAKTEFMANMSHEIRTPMNGILGITDLLLGTDLLPLQRQYMEMVKGSGEALLAVVNDVLDFSKIEAGAMGLCIVEFQLYETVQKVAEALSVRAFEKGLDLAVVIDPLLPRHFLGDPAKLRQVLMNLMGNAVKFTDRGEVALGIEGALSDAGSWRLVFSVRDTGIGIAKEKHELVFQSFSQADASTARAYGGTGLGLAISRRLVELMGGRIWLESREGAGSTFSFEVELAASTTPQVPLCRPPCALVGLRALVIDDNQTTRTMLQRELAARGVEVEETSEGGAGVRKAVEMQERGRPFDAILIDLHLPDLDGFQVAQRLRESYGLEQAALLMITSERIAETAQRADEMGLAYVVKPVRVEALLQALTQLRGGGMAEPEEVAPAAETFPIPPCTEILVAEDNPVNLTVTEAILRNAGALVSAATNGKEAVNAVTSRNFSAVLMDVQMPEIDGCTATHILRERGVSVPIIGLTAHALEGDRERCLAAGMNDYMSKPVSAEALVEKVGHWARLHPLPPAEPGQLLAQLGGDRGIFDGVVQSFMENVPEQLLDVLTAAQNEDAERLEKAAHRVKGALSVVRAERARCLAQAVEYAARSEDLGRARDLLPHLEGEVTRVIQQLQRPVPPLA